MAESLALKTKSNIELMLNSAQNFEKASLKLANAKKQDISGANFSSVMNDKMSANAEKIHTNFVDKMTQTNKPASNTAKKTKNITSLDSKEDFRKNVLKEELKNDSKKEAQELQEKKEIEEKRNTTNKQKDKIDESKEQDCEIEEKNKIEDNPNDENSKGEIQNTCEEQNPDDTLNSENKKNQNNKKDNLKNDNFENIQYPENFQGKDVLLDNQTENNEENKTSYESQILSNIDYSSFVEPSPVFSSSSAETKERSGNGDFALDESQDLLQNAVARTLKVQNVEFSNGNGNNFENSQNFANLTKENLEEFIKNNKFNPQELEEISSIFESTDLKDLKLNPETVAKINDLIKNSNQVQKQNHFEVMKDSNLDFKGKINVSDSDFEKTNLKSEFEIFQDENSSIEFENVEFQNPTPQILEKNSYSSASDMLVKQAFDENVVNNQPDSNSSFVDSFNLKGVEKFNFSKSSNVSELFSQKLNQSDVLNQITNKLSDSIQNGTKKLTMILRPYDLGRLSIELSTNKDGLMTNIIAQNEDVRNYIEKNINFLRQQLSDAGISIKNIEIKTAGQDSSTKYQGNSQNQENLTDLNQNSNSNKENDSFKQNGEKFQNLNENKQNNEDYQNLISNLGYELNFAKDFSSVFSKALEYGAN